MDADEVTRRSRGRSCRCHDTPLTRKLVVNSIQTQCWSKAHIRG